ncbi:MAG TPA: FAD-dependent monooxygenase [Tepidisphaeraceae bacterium]|nr:FAD-dependent monooxygenase [Tepidisphaeraceae bacterium]
MNDLLSLPEMTWDAMIVGAGPAGSASAALLARRGWRVLLVEKSSWPRDKVCGGCVNVSAISALRRMKLNGALRGSVNTHRAELNGYGSFLQIPIEGAVLSRNEFDRRLVHQAVELGTTFLSNTSAMLLDENESIEAETRTIELRQGDQLRTISARIVLIADGINGTTLRNQPWADWHIARNSWLGVACTLDAFDPNFAGGTIHMQIGAGGYVGIVRQPDNSLHLGAALDPKSCREVGGAVHLVERILRENQIDLKIDHPLHGTHLLTRHRPNVGAHRVLCVGDACGYVEPFTGEGIAWALQSAEAVVSILPNDPRVWPNDLPMRWKKLHRQTIGQRQRICRAIRFTIRSPLLWKSASAFARIAPRAAEWFADSRAPALAKRSS